MPEPPNNPDMQPMESHAELSVISTTPQCPGSGGVVAPAGAVTAAVPKLSKPMVLEVERSLAVGSAYILMQEVPSEEQEYREESGYGKKKQDSPVKLAMRRLSARIELGGVAKKFGDAMAKPWVIGESVKGGEKKIEVGRNLYPLEENEGAEGAGAGGEGRAEHSNSKRRSGAGDKWDIKHCRCS